MFSEHCKQLLLNVKCDFLEAGLSVVHGNHYKKKKVVLRLVSSMSVLNSIPVLKEFTAYL